MRQRRVKNLEQKYEKFADFIVTKPAEMPGSWHKMAQERGLSDAKFLEIGCGKGKFISELAAKNPENFYIAVEGHKSVLLRALEKASDAGLSNVVFIPEYVEDLRLWFDEAEIDGIFLNFSNPMPKNYSAKKRLTHRSKLSQYFAVLKEDGIVTFKTDNTDLFEFTIQEIRSADLKILELTRDLHHCEYGEDDIRTEYEYKFSERGENIKRVKIGRRTEGFQPADIDKVYMDRGDFEMSKSMAAFNGRTIPTEDRLFGINGRADAAINEKGSEKVIKATLGALYSDEGELITLSSVDESFRKLEPKDYAEYAPIAGLPAFREAVKKATFGSYVPKAFTEAVATPGGTGAIRLAVSSYTCPGDKVLTHDWYWTTYKGIADEQGRSIETFRMFNENGEFDLKDFDYKVKKLLRIQDRLMIILNTPANNPTGYSLSNEDWEGVIKTLNSAPQEKKICLFVDIAYIDFAGYEEEVRTFMPLLEKLNPNILSLMGYSASKTFTLYGCRCGALICMAKNEEVAAEFVSVCSYSSRTTWSNSPKGPQKVIADIFDSSDLLSRVDRERAYYRDMLLKRGYTFEKAAAEAGLEIVPFRGGFFASIPCVNPDKVSAKLEEDDVYLVAFANGLRVSIAAVSQEKCAKLPEIIKNAIESVK